MTDIQNTSDTVTGLVKWFDSRKGFGFVHVNGLPDVLLHANVLRNFGQNAVSDGAFITATIRTSQRGYQVHEILSLREPAKHAVTTSANFYGLPYEFLQKLEILPARVKWFSDVKGFGFVTTFGNSEDIFLHAETVRASAIGVVNAGEAVAVRVMEGDKGLLAVELFPWGSYIEE